MPSPRFIPLGRVRRGTPHAARRSLRVSLLLFFVALVVPIYFLVAHVYRQIELDASYRYRTLAEELTARINKGIYDLLELEERRSFDDYGFFKYITNMSLSAYHNIYNLRIFGIFGKYEDWEIRFISNAICKVLFGMDITIKQNVYFDYLYVDDFVDIVKKFIDMKVIPHKDINVCTGTRIDIETLARKVLNISNKSLQIKITRPGLANEYTGNNERLSRIIGKFKFSNFDQTIPYFYSWYTNNLHLVDKNKLLVDK